MLALQLQSSEAFRDMFGFLVQDSSTVSSVFLQASLEISR